MTLYNFNALSENSKAEHVWQCCNYIGNMIVDKSVLMLYGSHQEQTFFVEIEMNDNKIVNIRSFIKGEHLDKYLNCIDIEKMINE